MLNRALWWAGWALLHALAGFVGYIAFLLGGGFEFVHFLCDGQEPKDREQSVKMACRFPALLVGVEGALLTRSNPPPLETALVLYGGLGAVWWMVERRYLEWAELIG